MSTDDTLAQTYIKRFFVSTIDRDSSSLLGPDRYSETLVWEWDRATRERGSIVYQGGTSQGSLFEHFAVVKRIHETGTPQEVEPA